jgi:hypothetical protein
MIFEIGISAEMCFLLLTRLVICSHNWSLETLLGNDLI